MDGGGRKVSLTCAGDAAKAEVSGGGGFLDGCSAHGGGFGGVGGGGGGGCG